MNFLGKGTRVAILVLITIVLAIFLFMFFVPNLMQIPDSNPRQIAVVQIREIENTLELYYKHNGFYPTTEQGLEALVSKPTTDPQPGNYAEGGYFKKLPLDPWRNPFIYRNHGWGNPFIYRNHGEEGSIDIISCGPDGKEGTADDITNYQ